MKKQEEKTITIGYNEKTKRIKLYLEDENMNAKLILEVLMNAQYIIMKAIEKEQTK